MLLLGQEYAQKLNALFVRVGHMRKKFDVTKKKIKALKSGLSYTQAQPQELHQMVYDLQEQQLALDKQINGSPAKKEVGEKDTPTLSNRLSVASRGFYNNTYGPTKLHKESFDMALALVNMLSVHVDALAVNVNAAVTQAEAAGAPVILD